MTPIATGVQSLTEPIGYLGGRWMLHPDVLGPCREAGYPHGYAYYVAGRGGVLGDVDADVITAAFGFFEPALVRKMWNAGVAVEGAAAAAKRYGAACAQFGRARLVGFDGAARLAELAGRVAADADVTGLPLFAGWRRQPLPDDAAGRAYFLLHVLRELRGGAHLLAVVATGLGPRAAVFASGGTDSADRFGWAGPFDDLAGVSKKPAEDLTDEILTRLYSAVLTTDEVTELAGLVTAMRTHFDAYVPTDG
ncbi:MAG: evbL [Actinomycetia bacterium]|nr:evbL [Actinomycetes bacterium]